ncbi:aldo/keto reductase [Chitinophaga horti]|uniref:Aldo/keto reductase n=1 Tax=Chitinophaga horti TaxID=2920382 RepID=A0ABY6JC51_9BACT|nr:aldo/keto reductase [Chitinophaga horti]UYQ95879.1 aldo/keto reductase [Chitinophaga horti]
MSKILQLPEVIFGTSGLGNLYVALPDDVKNTILRECVQHGPRPLVFDTAGKYGAGLSLESLGKGLQLAGVQPDDVIVSNKLGWLRTDLTTPEPTFEPGVWKDLKHDAIQQISYDGIITCYEQGNALLNGYKAEWVSVHDPDEYLAAAQTETARRQRHQDILEAYRALHELKRQGKVTAIGIGAKSWKVIRDVAQEVELDWVMIANSMTLHSHPPELIAFMRHLSEKGVAVINSAVFNGGFLTGLDYYNYRPVSPDTHPALYEWRTAMYRLCALHHVRPEAACVAFGRRAPGVKSVALNTTNPKRVAANAVATQVVVPEQLWRDMVAEGLIDAGVEGWLY